MQAVQRGTGRRDRPHQTARAAVGVQRFPMVRKRRRSLEENQRDRQQGRRSEYVQARGPLDGAAEPYGRGTHEEVPRARRNGRYRIRAVGARGEFGSESDRGRSVRYSHDSGHSEGESRRRRGGECEFPERYHAGDVG